MPTLQTVSINISKMKVRWSEPYNSEAENKAHSALPRGVYRGGYLVPTSPESTSFKLVPDDGTGWWSDTFFAVRDKASGYLVTVTEPNEITFDMSAQFPLSGAKNWVVAGEVTYTVSGATVGNYKVIDAVDFTNDDKRVKLGEVTLTGVEATIAASKLSIVNRNEPVADKNENTAGFDSDLEQFYGYLSSLEAWRIPTLDQKKAMNAASPAPTSTNPFVTKENTLDKMFAEPSFVAKTELAGIKVQLIGKTIYVGKGLSGTAHKYVSLRNYTYIDDILRVGNDLYRVTALYNSTDTAILNPSVDADGDGFYPEPWVYFNIAYTGNLNIACFEKKDFSTVSGLAAQLVSTLLKFTEGKIDTIEREPSAINYKLLWRSFNTFTDAEVTKDTTSIYVIGGGTYGGLLFIVGGYVNSSGQVYAGTGTTTKNVIVWYMRSGSPLGASGDIRYLIKNGPAAGTNWSLTSLTSWDNAQDFTSSESVFFNTVNLRNNYITQLYPSSDDPGLIYMSGEDGAQIRFRIYWGPTPSSSFGTVWLTYNTGWDSSSNRWVRDSYILNPDLLAAWAIRINSDGLWFLFQDKDDDDIWQESDWSSILQWGEIDGRMFAAPIIHAGYDCVYVESEFYTSKSFVDTAVIGTLGGSYHGKWNSTSGPTVLQFKALNISANIDVTLYKAAIGDSEMFGFEVFVQANGAVADQELVYFACLVEAYV